MILTMRFYLSKLVSAAILLLAISKYSQQFSSRIFEVLGQALVRMVQMATGALLVCLLPLSYMHAELHTLGTIFPVHYEYIHSFDLRIPKFGIETFYLSIINSWQTCQHHGVPTKQLGHHCSFKLAIVIYFYGDLN